MRNVATLGVDVGTSSTKGVLVDLTGRVLRQATRAHSPTRPRPGWVEMDGDLWWAELVSICHELLAGEHPPVAAVGVSGMGPCVLLADEQDVPVRPAILYGVDTRASAQIERLTAGLGGDEVARRTGAPLSSQSAGAKIAWVAESEPDAYARAARLFMPSSWLVRHLTGAYVLDHHSASQCAPLYDLVGCDWYAPWAPTVAPDLELPPLRWANEVAGSVTASAAAVTGLPVGVPVITGTIDAWAEAISVDAHGIGDLLLMYGTTMFLVNTVDAQVTEPSLWSPVGAYEGTRSLAGGMATTGAVTTWLRDLVGSPDHQRLVDAAGRVPAGANGLVMLPYFAGERTPLLDPDARGVIAGLTLSHTAAHLYRAALEATGFGVRHNVETMLAAGAKISRVVAGGGGVQGSLWPQIVSDITGLEQVIPTQTIGASYGAAYLAAQSVADVAIGDWNPPREVLVPDPRPRDTYDELYRLYRDLYRGTADVVHALARLQQQAAPPLTTAAPASTGTTLSEATRNPRTPGAST